MSAESHSNAPWESPGSVLYQLHRASDNVLLYSVLSSPGWAPNLPFPPANTAHQSHYWLGINEAGDTIWRQELPPFCGCGGQPDCRWGLDRLDG